MLPPDCEAIVTAGPGDGAPARLYALMKLSRSALITSAFVVSMP